jgi:acyl-CoA synthetase (AMP-forming)/AMP-acid ligase II
MLRLCVSSGAALPPSIAAAFRAAWGRGLARQYGMSECGPITIDLEDRPEPDCVGRAYPGVELRIEAATGEILLRTASAASGFVGEPQQPPQARLLRTGDTGRLDAEGRLFLDARRALGINVHGRKLDPAEVEEAIRACAGVRDVAVVGIPTAAGDDRVAALVAGEGVGIEAVEEACRLRLAAWKMPRQVVIAAAVPRTAAGKPDRARIAAALAAG